MEVIPYLNPAESILKVFFPSGHQHPRLAPDYIRLHRLYGKCGCLFIRGFPLSHPFNSTGAEGRGPCLRTDRTPVLSAHYPAAVNPHCPTEYVDLFNQPGKKHILCLHDWCGRHYRPRPGHRFGHKPQS